MPVLASITMLPGSISLLASSGASALSVAAGKQPGLATRVRPSICEGQTSARPYVHPSTHPWSPPIHTIRPPVAGAWVAADVDDLHVLGHARQGLGRGAGRQRHKQHVELRQGGRVPLLNHHLGQLGRHTGETFHQPAAGAALACGVDQLERRVARDQAHRLAAAKTADPDNADANIHDVVSLLLSNYISKLPSMPRWLR